MKEIPKSSTKRCQECGGRVPSQAHYCIHCGGDLWLQAAAAEAGQADQSERAARPSASVRSR
jgi:hypothetical protein